MKRFLSATLGVLILAVCAGCGASHSGSSAAAADNSASASVPAVQSAVQSAEAAETAEADSSSAVANLNPAPEATVIESQDCFDAPYLFRPEADGTYHFCAQTADAFVGSDADYDGDTISWTIYVLEEEFTDAWRYLSQATHPVVSDLNGSTDLPLKSGQYVYCVCSLNAFTASPAPDGSGALSITPLDTPYEPSASNNYQLDITVGSESHLDLDGDGVEDTIYYSIRPTQMTSNGSYDMAMPESLTINGVEYLQTEAENTLSHYGVWLENPDVAYYYLVDLDTSDSYREIALADWGNSDWLTTHFFRFDGADLTYLGWASGLPDDHTTQFHGDGSITAMTRLDVMQTWSGLRTYRLENDQLQQVDGEFCVPVLPDGWKVTLRRELTVYERPDRSSGQLTLSPASTALSFPSTDGEHWVEIQCANGDTGWAYFPEIFQVESGSQALDADEVFGNLFLVS